MYIYIYIMGIIWIYIFCKYIPNHIPHASCRLHDAPQSWPALSPQGTSSSASASLTIDLQSHPPFIWNTTKPWSADDSWRYLGLRFRDVWSEGRWDQWDIMYYCRCRRRILCLWEPKKHWQTRQAFTKLHPPYGIHLAYSLPFNPGNPPIKIWMMFNCHVWLPG